MRTITDLKIQKSDKTRANLYLDGEFVCGVEMVTVMKLGLKIGQDISEEKLQEAIFDSEKSVAFGKAVDYLSRCMKTSKQVSDYLYKKGYTPQVVRYVVQKLTEYRYVDDALYAKLYTEQNSRNKGNRRIQMELMQKGIKRETVESTQPVPHETAMQAAERLAAKYMKNKTVDNKTLQNLQRFLLYRGYDFDVVNSVVNKLKIDE